MTTTVSPGSLRRVDVGFRLSPRRSSRNRYNRERHGRGERSQEPRARARNVYVHRHSKREQLLSCQRERLNLPADLFTIVPNSLASVGCSFDPVQNILQHTYPLIYICYIVCICLYLYTSRRESNGKRDNRRRSRKRCPPLALLSSPLDDTMDLRT